MSGPDYRYSGPTRCWKPSGGLELDDEVPDERRPPAPIQHGTISGYHRGCRSECCRKVAREQRAHYRALARARG